MGYRIAPHEAPFSQASFHNHSEVISGIQGALEYLVVQNAKYLLSLADSDQLLDQYTNPTQVSLVGVTAVNDLKNWIKSDTHYPVPKHYLYDVAQQASLLMPNGKPGNGQLPITKFILTSAPDLSYEYLPNLTDSWPTSLSLPTILYLTTQIQIDSYGQLGASPIQGILRASAHHILYRQYRVGGSMQLGYKTQAMVQLDDRDQVVVNKYAAKYQDKHLTNSLSQGRVKRTHKHKGPDGTTPDDF